MPDESRSQVAGIGSWLGKPSLWAAFKSKSRLQGLFSRHTAMVTNPVHMKYSITMFLWLLITQAPFGDPDTSLLLVNPVVELVLCLCCVAPFMLGSQVGFQACILWLNFVAQFYSWALCWILQLSFMTWLSLCLHFMTGFCILVLWHGFMLDSVTGFYDCVLQLGLWLYSEDGFHNRVWILILQWVLCGSLSGAYG